MVEVKNYKEQINFKDSENKKLQTSVLELKQILEKEKDKQSSTNELEKEIQCLRDKICDLETEKTQTMKNYGEEYMRFHNEGLEKVKEETEKFYKLELLKKDLEIESMKKELEEIKNLYVEVFSSKEALLNQMEKDKNSSGRNSAVDLEEVKRLQKELEKSRHRILELDQTLKQQYQQEVEILNLDINQLNLQVEKMKKEKDREIAEKDRILVENELLKSEIEQVTSEKNLLFLKIEKQQKESKEILKNELEEQNEKHKFELENLNHKYEQMIRKLQKEVELSLSKEAKSESKYTSPLKFTCRSVESQSSPVSFDNKATSPTRNLFTKDTSTSPIDVFKKSPRKLSRENVSPTEGATDSEPEKLTKKEVIEIMEKLAAHHEGEMKDLEIKYRAELGKLNKKFQTEIVKVQDTIRCELRKEHMAEIEDLEEKHRMELENRIDQEKKDAIAELITEWACEVQSLKASYAEAQTEIERLKMKYKAAKSLAMQYKVSILLFKIYYY